MENQRNEGLNVGFVYSLYSFLFPLLFTYSVGVNQPYIDGCVRNHILSVQNSFIGEQKTK